mmetsp:Transcript_20765/g.66701  ORF Transcript_20765/g.66701 Transcript_20765/m.66701 type:complete len:257 (+) Transcript_20765:419-1189(+)
MRAATVTTNSARRLESVSGTQRTSLATCAQEKRKEHDCARSAASLLRNDSSIFSSLASSRAVGGGGASSPPSFSSPPSASASALLPPLPPFASRPRPELLSSALPFAPRRRPLRPPDGASPSSSTPLSSAACNAADAASRFASSFFLASSRTLHAASHSASCCSTSSASLGLSVCAGTTRALSKRTSSPGLSTRRRRSRSSCLNRLSLIGCLGARGNRVSTKSNSITPDAGMTKSDEIITALLLYLSFRKQSPVPC